MCRKSQTEEQDLDRRGINHEGIWNLKQELSNDSNYNSNGEKTCFKYNVIVLTCCNSGISKSDSVEAFQILLLSLG